MEINFVVLYRNDVIPYSGFATYDGALAGRDAFIEMGIAPETLTIKAVIDVDDLQRLTNEGNEE